MTPSSRPRKRAYHQHGHGLVTKALPFLSARVTDPSIPVEDLSPVERGARDLRQDMLTDLGGPEAVSAASRALLDATVGSLIILQSIDQYLFTLAPSGGLVNKRSRRAFSIVADRMRVADSLARQLGVLGLERRGHPVPDLTSYITHKYGPGGSPVPTVANSPRCEESAGSEESGPADSPSPTTEETDGHDPD